MSRGLRPLLILAFLALPYLVFSQSNEQIDSILAQDVATVGSAAYLALSAADLINDESSLDLAVTVAAEAGWLPAEAIADDEASFGTVAFLLMQATEVNGGLLYRIFPGPRYAAREFVYQGWSPEDREPNSTVTGQFLVRVTGNFLDMTEATR